MPLAKDIGDYLEDQGIGTMGTTIFAGYLPDSPDAAIATAPTQGLPPIIPNTDIEVTGLQIRVRSTTYALAQTKVTDIFKILHELTHTTINTQTYKRIEAQGSPVFIGRDEKSRPNFTQNYLVYKIIDT